MADREAWINKRSLSKEVNRAPENNLRFTLVELFSQPLIEKQGFKITNPREIQKNMLKQQIISKPQQIIKYKMQTQKKPQNRESRNR